MQKDHRVAVMAAPGMSLFELSIVLEVFALERPELDVAWWYSVDVFTPHPGELATLGGATLTVPQGLEAIAGADTLVIPSWPIGREVPADLEAAVKTAAARGARLMSICSGVFVLAATGLLDGRRAATHWLYAEELARRHPAVCVDSSVLYVDEGDVKTSAGSAAGIDLALHVVRGDHGAAIANAVARRLVVPPIREGGQAQYVEAPVPQLGDDRIQQVISWISRDLTHPISVRSAAHRAHMSERTFTRRFKQVTGTTFLEWSVGHRIHASLPILETGDDSIDHVAHMVGFQDPNVYRRHFKTRLLTTPSAYRRAFQAL